MKTNLLIIGAGPFGLAMAARAAHLNIDHVIVGESMSFWRNHMPKGMFLRSACDWHLDPQNIHTIVEYVTSQGKTPKDVEPLALDYYLSYVNWFQTKKRIRPLPHFIKALNYDKRARQFSAVTGDGSEISATRVVIAPGFKHFAFAPPELTSILPLQSFRHTCDFVDFKDATGKRFLIVGGRQSAFEWAALLNEAGAHAIHLSHRHDSPKFTPSEWAWVTPLVDHIVENPRWFRELPQAEQEELNRRLWAEGRLKVEPWLKPRLQGDNVFIWPNTQITSATRSASSDLVVTLTNGESFDVDEIILATGYKVEINKLPILASGNILENLATRSGYPVLDDHLQTSVPGLFITSMPATQDFGPFFGFTIAVRTSAKLICAACR